MFIVSLVYTAPLEDVDAFIAAHVEYLQAQYAKGFFLASGPKVPRTGGVIIARCESREVLDRVLDEDPFRRNNLARYEVTEFISTMTAPGVESWREIAPGKV